VKSTVHQVARRANVSVGTVSNVLNRPQIVAPATRERVLRVIDELGFVRNESARELRTGVARVIGLVIVDLANPFFSDLMRGVEDAAYEAGYSVIVCNSDEDPAREEAYIRVLEERGVKGMLIVPTGPSSPAVARLRARGTAVVRVTHRIADDECGVGSDDRLGGELAMRHLLALGHERVGYVTSASHVWPTDERRAGALAAGNRGARLVDITVGEASVADGRDAGERLLALQPRPTAVICANDLLALGVLQVLVRHGLRVPDDMAIVGFDDIEFASAAAIPLTSVRLPRRAIGRIATELLLAEAGGDPDHVHRRIVLQPEVVPRESTIGS
jgi:LacI family transcriptional regulator